MEVLIFHLCEGVYLGQQDEDEAFLNELRDAISEMFRRQRGPEKSLKLLAINLTQHDDDDTPQFFERVFDPLLSPLGFTYQDSGMWKVPAYVPGNDGKSFLECDFFTSNLVETNI